MWNLHNCTVHFKENLPSLYYFVLQWTFYNTLHFNDKIIFCYVSSPTMNKNDHKAQSVNHDRDREILANVISCTRIARIENEPKVRSERSTSQPLTANREKGLPHGKWRKTRRRLRNNSTPTPSRARTQRGQSCAASRKINKNRWT